AAFNTNGLLTQTAADTFTGRTLTGTANSIGVTNGDGVSGNPTLALSPYIDVNSGALVRGVGYWTALSTALVGSTDSAGTLLIGNTTTSVVLGANYSFARLFIAN